MEDAHRRFPCQIWLNGRQPGSGNSRQDPHNRPGAACRRRTARCAGRSGPFTVADRRALFILAEAVAAIAMARLRSALPPPLRQCAVQEAADRLRRRDARHCDLRRRDVRGQGRPRASGPGRPRRGAGLHPYGVETQRRGIRIEEGDLQVSQVCSSTARRNPLRQRPERTITIDYSTSAARQASRRQRRPFAHVGHYGALRITNSRFGAARAATISSRSPRAEILNNSFDDSQGRDTNYLIDLPEGAVGRIAGNTFVQGVGKENYGTLIAIHAEEGANPSAGLVIEDNIASVAPGFQWTTVLVGDWSGEALVMRNNRLGPRITAFERR